MSFMLSVAMVLQVLTALGVIILVLLQHGKGADMGAAFGSGSSGSLFGASGSANFLSRLTGVLAAVFFASTLVLSFMSQRPGTNTGSGSVMDQPARGGEVKVPAVPAVKSDIPSAPTGSPASERTDAPKADTGKSEPARSDGPKPESDKPGQGGIPK